MFDLGNVIFPLEFDDFDRWLEGCQVQVPEGAPPFYERYFPIYLAFESGEISNEVFMEKLRHDLRLEFDAQEFESRWISCWKRDMPGMEELLLEFKGCETLMVLSNTNDLHMRNFLKTKGILQHFDRLFYSHELHCAKPDLEIYEKVNAAVGGEPSRILFFDDKPENIEGARRAGWKAEVFESAEVCRSVMMNHLEGLSRV